MVTDKELLTFCNLANLEMEYANLIYEQTVKSGGKTKTEKRNHTIYTIFL